MSRAPLSDEEGAALEELLEANGATRATADQVLHLEMFLHVYPQMLGLQQFPNLRTLAIIHQGVKEIECLEACVLLEKLWLVENELSSMRGLQTLLKLKELHLYSNKIPRLEGLEKLTNLEVLSLADNYIGMIEGISHLTKLRELNLARNDIATVGDALARNTTLEILNLADNQIGNFKEMRGLARLPHLTELSFADPMWGECPVAGLCNYQTFCLFLLPQLHVLDTLLLADETQALAEATFLKKQMYYNMRIKTLHRHARNIIRLAAEGHKVVQRLWQPLLSRLALAQRDGQRELEEAAANYPDRPAADASHAQALKTKLEGINARLHQYAAQEAKEEAAFDAATARTYSLVDAHVSRMMLELETAGNIRLEDGRPQDLWYSSCVDLLQTRFNAADCKALGIEGITVTGVTRIHNRWLRTRFERALNMTTEALAGGPAPPAAVANGDGAPAAAAPAAPTAPKRAVEYLFLAEHPALPGEMDRIVEEGFRPVHQLAAMGMDAAVVLATSVQLADSLRLAAMIEQHRTPAGQHQQPAVGRLMIVKAHLGRTSSDTCSIGNKAPQPLYKDGRLMVGATLEGPRLGQTSYPNADAVYRSKQTDHKQRMWYVFEPSLVLPEYLVEFSYQLSPGSVLERPLSPGELPLSTSTCQAVMDGLEPDQRVLARPMLSWLALHTEPHLAQQRIPHNEEAQVTNICDAPPVIAPRAKLYILNEDAMVKHIGVEGMALSSLTYLDLHNCALRKVEGLHGLTSLKVLVLSFNEISKMGDLSDLVGLQKLDLAHNTIKRLDGLKGLSALSSLDMSFNQIVKIEETHALKRYTPSLTWLDLSNNPLCDDKSYRPTVLRKLPGLQLLDNCTVSAQDKSQYVENAGAVTSQMVAEFGVSGHRLGVTDGALAGVARHTVPPASISELLLDRKHIRRLQALNGLTGLRRASFADNELSNMDGLEGCVNLEELCLEGNRITTISGLSTLTRLKKLQLGKNRISMLEGMTSLTNVTQLSIEDNELTSLAGVEHLVQLMELYAGNNRIAELREVQRLKELAKLIILDLSGNALASIPSDDYRLYVIYNVRKLKVLDGSSVDATEAASARAKYSGRLTLEFLEEKLSHRLFDRIRDLDAAGLKVRDVGTVFLGDEFESLQELCLDNNLLVDVSGLALLRQLVVLKMNNNRLAEDCSFNPRRLLERNSDLNRMQMDVGTAFEPFPFLQVLQLGGNQIASIGSLQLSSMTTLRSLFLQNNDITRIDGLEGLVHLQELVLDRNRIRYIDPEVFNGTPRLRELRLEENGLRSLCNLSQLAQLQSLHLGHNRIAEASELDRLCSLTSLVELSLTNNAVTRKQAYRPMVVNRCARLCMLDGVPITSEERDYADTICNQALEAQAAALSGAVVGAPKVAIKMTNLDFAGLVPGLGAGAVGMGYAAQAGFGNGGGGGNAPTSSVPSIQSATLVLAGSAGLGLEGFGFSDGNGRDAWGRPNSDRRTAAALGVGGTGVAGIGSHLGRTGAGKDASPSKGAPSPARRPAVVRGPGFRAFQQQQ